MVKLSPRLETIYNILPKTHTVVDVGCDHCYLSIELIKNKKVQLAIASDVNLEPLENCKKNIRQNSVSNIKTILSNGFESINDHFDSVIISGMGAKLIINILEQRNDLKEKTLVLQPQNGEAKLRKWLKTKDFKIVDEKNVLDNNVIYTVILVANNGEVIKDDADIFIGPILKSEKSELNKQKINYRKKHLLSFVGNIKEKDKIKEIETELTAINSFLEE